MAASIEFHTLNILENAQIAGFNVTTILQEHPGKSFGYAFEKNAKKIVYSTDSEHKDNLDFNNSRFVDFFKNSDVLIFDAQYSLVEAEIIKKDWGHSNNLLAVEFSSAALVKHLILFHNEPMRNDFNLDKLLF